MVRRFLHLSLPALAAALASPGPAEPTLLPVTADTSICCYESERNQNAGKAPRLRMKGIENVLLLDIDPGPVRGLRVIRAALRIRGTHDKMMVRKVGFSTVATPWKEGASEQYQKAREGDACFFSPELGRRTWAGPGSTFLDAVWGRGGTIWMQSYVKPDAEMWFEMEFDGRLIEACAAGLSSGIAASDDNGQAMNVYPDLARGFTPNNTFFSREQNSAQPAFLVVAEPMPRVAPTPLVVTASPWPAGADFETGGLEIGWPGPRDEAEYRATLGYRIRLGPDGGEIKEIPRWMHPAPARPGERVRALLRGQPAGVPVRAEVEVVGRGGAVTQRGAAAGRVSPKYREPAVPALKKMDALAGAPGAAWAVPDGVKVNPVTGNVLDEGGIEYLGPRAGTYRQRNAIWSGRDRTVTLAALRGEWVACQVVCEGTGKRLVTASELRGAGAGTIAAPRLFRAWYQKVGDGAAAWYADPLRPLGPREVFTIPDTTNAVPAQTNQTVYVEYFVPKDARPGTYGGKIQVDSEVLSVRLDVAEAALPDRAHFVFSMNAYGSPGSDYGAADTEEFLAAERSFYAMAHEHRTTLAVLHYSHNGNYQEGAVPLVSGKGRQMKVADWSRWDRRFGPLFDASAFKGTPREGVPLDHFYLALCEHYPTPMAQGYKWNGVTWEEHWKAAGPVEEGFSGEYQEQWVAVASDHLRHIREKGWRTTFQVFLNDKYGAKLYDPQTKSPGRGVSFWLLDEPVHVDDFSALAFFGRLLRQAQAGDRQRMVFRVDTSRPEWGRDVLDRFVDLDASSVFRARRPLLEDWRERYGHAVWAYGGAPDSTSSALSICAQALDFYARGADGFLPWMTLGGPENWEKFESTCVLYTGKPLGIAGACPSIRLKMYRRAEQDVEYVRLLADKAGILKDDPNRRQVARLLETLHRSLRKSEGANDPAAELFADGSPEDFERLRRTIAASLNR